MEENKNVEESTQEINVDEKAYANVEGNEKEIEELNEVDQDVLEAQENTEIKEEESSDKASEYLERLQRLMAEFDNYRKRSEKEKLNMYDVAVSDVITDILPVVDNFERALKQGDKEDGFYKGVEMIYKQLMNVFESFKIETIQSEGEVFNPNLHNAVFHVEDENVGENVIVEELQKGYLYKERVLRHSMVKVAN